MPEWLNSFTQSNTLTVDMIRNQLKSWPISKQICKETQDLRSWIKDTIQKFLELNQSPVNQATIH